MSAADVLLKPEECVMLLIDFQAGLGFGVESIPRQVVLNNAVALARTGVAFKVPVIASTSASRVYITAHVSHTSEVGSLRCNVEDSERGSTKRVDWLCRFSLSILDRFGPPA